MQHHKIAEENKRDKLNNYIEEQRKIIAEKEDQIRTKNEEIQKMEDDYNTQLQAMRNEYNTEMKK